MMKDARDESPDRDASKGEGFSPELLKGGFALALLALLRPA
jgi:hypothetical protein